MTREAASGEGRRGGEDGLIKIDEKFKGTLRASTSARLITRGRLLQAQGENEEKLKRSERVGGNGGAQCSAEKGSSLMSLSAPQVILHPLH